MQNIGLVMCLFLFCFLFCLFVCLFVCFIFVLYSNIFPSSSLAAVKPAGRGVDTKPAMPGSTLSFIFLVSFPSPHYTSSFSIIYLPFSCVCSQIKQPNRHLWEDLRGSKREKRMREILWKLETCLRLASRKTSWCVFFFFFFFFLNTKVNRKLTRQIPTIPLCCLS
jgi:hypothetical protein